MIVIGGPTATGKTALAIGLAEDLIAQGIACEIVSADSRQVYRGLDIGTAKATPGERARIVHHGLDLVEPDQPFSIADLSNPCPGCPDRTGCARRDRDPRRRNRVLAASGDGRDRYRRAALEPGDPGRARG